MYALLLLGCDMGTPASGGADGAPEDEPVVTEPPAACARAPAVTWDAWGHGFFLTWCSACHSATTPDRRGAPEGVDFDTWAQVQAQSERIRVRTLDDQTMPVGGGLYPADLALLEVLLTCSR